MFIGLVGLLTGLARDETSTHRPTKSGGRNSENQMKFLKSSFLAKSKNIRHIKISGCFYRMVGL